ncbi:DUF6497 family protein [Litoreibacter arenae]|uniref:Acetolactate synthase n=1 Tax=Litoreibacter arenae DSM 19593 TaxID=1123360 RepID=S9QJS5_9RHOB|nr:DUF6497 family protein [Litoreibacter arenae]EPX79848.1 hypothetical protein thalar_01184 [Litoreibacter arenae DSM 19593]
MTLIGSAFVTTPILAEQPPLRAVSAVEYEPHEILFEPAEADRPERRIVRIRLVAPGIADKEKFGFEVIEADFQSLCDSEGLRIVAESAPNAREIIVSVASGRVPFGETVPNVVQYFDAFSVDGDTCVWVGL